MLISTNIMASPITDLNKVGEGEMHYLFWTIYAAEFYRSEHSAPEVRQALRITYYKSISQQNLIEATLDQWQHLGYQPEEMVRWSVSLVKIWPSVKPGDKLTFVSNNHGEGQFFFDGKPIGSIQDPTFADAFLDIWLSERTTEPKLRKQLLGLSQ
ncbi:chalcone isomerase family protein [Vibrio sp. S4M6]|nr:chalcone isomerase family protein [Vibrio sinus]MCL9782371.1 chalcone isomerase family protein [Vibrio sinus]